MGRKTNHQKRYEHSGRPEKIDAIVLQKLEDAFSNAFPDAEACLYAGIAPATLYNYQLKNPEFLEKKKALKLTPNMKARRTIIAALGNAPDAWRWIEKKDHEFMPASKVEHSGVVGVAGIPEELSEEEKTIFTKLREARRKRIEQKSDNL
jgi:hypothetical protein